MTHGKIELPIRYGSVEHACIHEAGHILAAISVGAEVVEVEIYSGPPPFGRTRVNRTEAQRQRIAAGGFGIERNLWERKNLLLEDGNIATEVEMLNRSSDNAADDKIAFHGGDFSDDGRWSKELDLEFMKYAREVGRSFDLQAALGIASELKAIRRLDGPKLQATLKRHLSA